MFKKIIFVLMCATAASSCLKEVSNYDKKLFLDDVDAQGIKLFMLSHKVVEGEDGPELALTTENDPENMWNNPILNSYYQLSTRIWVMNQKARNIRIKP